MEFFEVNFWSRDFWGVSIGSPRDFFGFWFLPSFDHPCHLKSVEPWACYTASKFLWAACLLRPFWFVHAKGPYIGRDLDLQYLSKVSLQSVASLDVRLDLRFSIPAQMENREQAIENQVEDRVSQDRKQKMHPPLIILQRPTAVTQHGMVIHVFAQATVCSKLEQFKL